jgi:uncharacterized membrane protein YgdD (TMEM256/DUF423 family)
MACGRQTRHLDGSAVSQDRLFLLAGAISGFLGVGAGAFGAHGLRARLTPELLSVFETAVRYQMYHALALIAAGWVASRWPGALAGASGWLFVVGTVVFSGSLYALALTGTRWLGAVTPLGGLCFLAGWLCLAAAALRGSSG